MSKSRAHRRPAKYRRAVDRTERVKPSPMAETKKRPWARLSGSLVRWRMSTGSMLYALSLRD
jgi:hypothetical protein